MKGVRELNLELGMPSADESLRRLAADMAACRKLGQPIVKVIHGYGSSGRGGRIRTATRKFLKEELAAGRIKALIPGEEFSIFSEDTRRAFTLAPALRDDHDLERENRGVTYIVL